MPLKYWRTMLIASALGVCGLAVWANDKTPDKPAVPMPAPSPVPLPGPVVDAAKDDVFPAPKPADPSPEPIKVLELAGNPPAPSLPVAPPVVPPPVMPTKAEAPPSLDLDIPPAAPKQAPPPVDKPIPPAPPLNDPPPLPKGALDLPPAAPVIKIRSANDAPPPATKEQKYTPLPVDPTPIMPVATNPMPTSTPPVPAAAPVVYKLHVHMGGDLGPRFEVRSGDSLLLKVYCDHIDMQGSKQGSKSIPGLTATGNVRVAGSGVSGTCDSLTIAAAKGEVTLKGNVKLNCYRGNASSEISSEAMNFQLKGTKDAPEKIHAAGVSSVTSGSR